MSAHVEPATAVLRLARERADITSAVERRNRTVRTALGKDITSTGMHILAALVLSERLVTPGELITETQQTSGSVTKQLDALERNGLVVRTKSRVDRRSVHVSITNYGRAVLAATAETYLQAASS